MLGLQEGATDDKIKKAFYAMAKKYHPDSVASSSSNQTKSEAEKKFKEVNEAYEVLGKKDKKAIYDEMRRASRMHNGRAGHQAD